MSKLFYRYGSMNTGKSTELLQIAYNYRSQDMAVELFTAEVDHRAGVGMIASRLGISAPAATFNADTDFFQVISDLCARVDCKAVLIDEAQFTTAAQVRQLHRAAHLLNVPVMCFGIRSDFQGNPFEGSAYLMSLADDLEEIKAICACGRKSTMNLRIDAEGRPVVKGAQLDIGGNSRYRQVCGRCFYTTTA